MTQEELKAELLRQKEQNEKAKAEILAKFKTLEDAIAAAKEVSPEVQAAVADLGASIQGSDDIVPDVQPA